MKRTARLSSTLFLLFFIQISFAARDPLGTWTTSELSQPSVFTVYRDYQYQLYYPVGIPQIPAGFYDGTERLEMPPSYVPDGPEAEFFFLSDPFIFKDILYCGDALVGSDSNGDLFFYCAGENDQAPTPDSFYMVDVDAFTNHNQRASWAAAGMNSLVNSQTPAEPPTTTNPVLINYSAASYGQIALNSNELDDPTLLPPLPEDPDRDKERRYSIVKDDIRSVTIIPFKVVPKDPSTIPTNMVTVNLRYITDMFLEDASLDPISWCISGGLPDQSPPECSSVLMRSGIRVSETPTPAELLSQWDVPGISGTVYGEVDAQQSLLDFNTTLNQIAFLDQGTLQADVPVNQINYINIYSQSNNRLGRNTAANFTFHNNTNLIFKEYPPALISQSDQLDTEKSSHGVTAPVSGLEIDPSSPFANDFEIISTEQSSNARITGNLPEQNSANIWTLAASSQSLLFCNGQIGLFLPEVNEIRILDNTSTSYCLPESTIDPGGKVLDGFVYFDSAQQLMFVSEDGQTNNPVFDDPNDAYLPWLNSGFHNNSAMVTDYKFAYYGADIDPSPSNLEVGIVKTNGTREGTTILTTATFPDGLQARNYDLLTILGGHLYFTADNFLSSMSDGPLFRYNGQQSAQQIPITGTQTLYEFTTIADRYLVVADLNNSWVIDDQTGTSQSLSSLAPSHPGISFKLIHEKTLNEYALLQGSDGQIWRTDGTVSGTIPILQPETGYEAVPGAVALHNGYIYFSLKRENHEGKLYLSDGTAQGTRLVQLTAQSGYVAAMYQLNGFLFYAYEYIGNDSTFEFPARDLWMTSQEDFHAKVFSGSTVQVNIGFNSVGQLISGGNRLFFRGSAKSFPENGGTPGQSDSEFYWIDLDTPGIIPTSSVQQPSEGPLLGPLLPDFSLFSDGFEN